MSLNIDIKNLPDDGLFLSGKLPASVFALSPEDPTQPVTPLEYEITVTRDEEGLIIFGSLTATFSMVCGRCSEPFETRVDLPTYGQEVPLENERHTDLTSILREDILLALPTYPRCETGNVTPRECPAEGHFESTQDELLDESGENGRSQAWGALDQLKNPNSN